MVENFSTKRAEAYDVKWYPRLESQIFEDYEKLSGDKIIRSQEKKKFLLDVTSIPSLDYPSLEEFDFDNRERYLLELKNDIIESESNETVLKIYRARINELLASIRMLRAAKNGEDRKFSKYSDFIYGTPSIENTAYVLTSINSKLDSDQSDWSNERRKAAARIISMTDGYSSIVDGDYVDKSVLPSGSGNYEGFVKDDTDARERLVRALSELGIDDWEVIIDRDKGVSNFSVSQESKTINIPETEKIIERKISYKKLAGLIAHEIGTHVSRRHNGERSRLRLLGLGLDRYV